MVRTSTAFSAVFLLSASMLACSEDKGASNGNTGGSGNTVPDNSAFCADTCIGGEFQAATGRPVDSCCVAVGEPGNSSSNPYLKRTTDTDEYADPKGGAPDISCFEPAGYPSQPPAGGTSKTATLKGVVTTFANGGCVADDLIGPNAVTVEVYKVKRTGDPATDGALGDLVGTALVTNDQMPIVEEQVTNCNDDPKLNREYSYPEVPMYTELVVKSSGTGWAPLYSYNIYITENDADYDSGAGTYKYDVRALAEGDFQTIPTVAIGKTITAGNGAIGGEVHDCKNVRLQFARVDVSVSRKGLVYFNDDEDDPLPDVTREFIGTGKTALYSALDIKVPGPEGSYARMAGVGLVPGSDGDRLVSLGYFDVRVFPNSVTSVTLRGLRPFQVPK
ncbi:MAG: hypothetical protein R3B13_23275 [Polyangiaceae bacterium]